MFLKRTANLHVVFFDDSFHLYLLYVSGAVREINSPLHVRLLSYPPVGHSILLFILPSLTLGFDHAHSALLSASISIMWPNPKRYSHDSPHRHRLLRSPLYCMRSAKLSSSRTPPQTSPLFRLTI